MVGCGLAGPGPGRFPLPASGAAPMEIGPEPRRPCDFPGQPAHQNGPRSRPMGMGRAFSCPFLGNSSAPRGAAGARSALKSPGGGRTAPARGFSFARPGGPWPWAAKRRRPPSDAPASPKAESRPRPILGESAGQPNPFFRKGPSRKLSLSPMFQGLWPATFGKGPPPPRRHPRQGSSRFPPAEAGAKAAGFRQ